MDSSRDVGLYVVSTPQTAMFRYGPAQSFGADFNLQQGQRVVMMRKEYGYSRVMTESGQTGYVATEDLAPAPPESKRKNTTPTGKLPPLINLQSTGTGHPGVSSSNNRVLQGGPLFGPGELPPLPEKDVHAAKPEFRYPKPKPGFRVTAPTPNAAPEEKQ